MKIPAVLRLALLTACVLPLANCATPEGMGSYAAPAPMSSPSSPPMPESPAEYSGRGETDAAPAAKRRTHRMGLATSAGDTRYSALNALAFFRKPTGQPDAVDSFNYNDETGAEAMMEAVGGGRKRSGTFSVAGGRLEVGLTPVYSSRPLERLEGAGRRVVIGQGGNSYGIALTNRTGHPVEVVASVDGLDVMTGKAASVKSRGYVIPAKGELSIEGWRVDQKTVRRFVFGSVDASAAARAGLARNVGVIGLAVYDEDEAQARMARLAESQKRGAASAFPGATRQ